MLPGLQKLASTTGAARGRNQALSMPNLQKVTVIDDDPTMLKAIERLLRVKGFDVETFTSAEAFLAGARQGRLSRSGHSFGRDVRHRATASAGRLRIPSSDHIHHRR